jgi:hypothetical protein
MSLFDDTWKLMLSPEPEDCSEEEAEAHWRDIWERWEKDEWCEWRNEILSTPGLFRGEPSDLDSLRLEYVPNAVRKCPHCENSSRMVSRRRWSYERLLILHAKKVHRSNLFRALGTEAKIYLGVNFILIALVIHLLTT